MLGGSLFLRNPSGVHSKRLIPRNMRLTNLCPILESGRFMRQKLSPDVKRLFLIYFLATKVHKNILFWGRFWLSLTLFAEKFKKKNVFSWNILIIIFQNSRIMKIIIYRFKNIYNPLFQKKCLQNYLYEMIDFIFTIRLLISIIYNLSISLLLNLIFSIQYHINYSSFTTKHYM